jgi:hypothetical protein
MAQVGRPPKPVELKRLTGNPGKRALPDQSSVMLISQASSTPEPARPLLKYGKELWDRVWESGIAWISPNSDIEILLMTCEMVDERWNLRVKVMTDNNPKDRRGLRELEKSIYSNLSLLGFTPTDRSRLGVAEVKKMSKLEELLTKKANRE